MQTPSPHSREPAMSRSFLIFLAGLVAIAVLVAVCLAPAKSVTPSPYRPLPGNLFTAVPGSAGGAGTRLRPDRPTASAVDGQGNAVSRPGDLSSTPRSGSPRPPRTVTRQSGPSIDGLATWYAFHTGQAAAAKPLRDFLGAGWRGSFIHVCHNGLCLRLRLTDYESSLLPGRLIDLSSQDFRRLCGPLSQGICSVRVSR